LVSYINGLNSGDRVSVFNIEAKVKTGDVVLDGIKVTDFTLSIK
jgi:hypothetical protein